MIFSLPLCGSCRSQFFVFEIAGFEEFEHGVTEQVRVLAVLETPRHLVKVGLQMLRAHQLTCFPRRADARLGFVLSPVVPGTDVPG